MPDWVESAITEAISEFKQLPADAIRGNFAEIYAQDDDSALTAFLKMQTAIETAETTCERTPLEGLPRTSLITIWRVMTPWLAPRQSSWRQETERTITNLSTRRPRFL